MSTLEKPTDTLSRFCRGDRGAFEELYRLHAPMLLSWLKPRCWGKLEVEEVAQQTWVKVWSNREKFHGGNFCGWLVTVASNVKTDLSRRQTRRKDKVELNEEVSPPAAPMNDDGDVQERLDSLRDCLQRVGGPFVEVLRLRLDGMENQQIADHLNIPMATLHSRASRGRDALRACMEHKS